MANGAQQTLEKSITETYRKRIAGASGHLARISVLQELEEALKETDQVSLEKYLGCFLNSGKKIDPNGLSMKMLRVCLARTKDLTTFPYSVSLTRGGYDAEWQIFNSKDFGVPQNRERVYTVGHLRAKGSRTIFPIEAADGANSIQVSLIGTRDGYHKNLQTYSPNGVTGTLDTAGGGQRTPRSLTTQGGGMTMGYQRATPH